MKRFVNSISASVAVSAITVAAPAMAAASPSTNSPSDSKTPKVLSASWGTDNGVACPNGPSGLDNLPVTFSSFIKHTSIRDQEFTIIRSDGTKVHPTCAIPFPPDELDEAQTVNLIGDFGDSVNGPVPQRVRVGLGLKAKAPGTHKWRRVGRLPATTVNQISGGPFITDIWRMNLPIYKHDPNRCMTGTYFVRVMWSNGLTAYPTGQEVGSAVTQSYRAVFRLKNGKKRAFEPLAVADLNDHPPNTFNDDNMHDLCLSGVPRKATLLAVKVGANLIQDPNGDPNTAQYFRTRTKSSGRIVAVASYQSQSRSAP